MTSALSTLAPSAAQVHRGLSYEAYAALPGWRWSHIKLLKDGSPLHVKHALTARDNDTASRRFLRAVHALVFEGPKAYDARYTIFEGARRGKAYDAFCDLHPGREILSGGEAYKVGRIAKAVWTHPAIRPHFTTGEGHGEVSITWTDEPTGLPLKARLDWLSPLGILDLKTAGTTNERQFASKVASMLWHAQIAHYKAACEAAGIEVPLCALIAAEGDAPFDVALFPLDPGKPDGSLHQGELLRRELLEQLAECVATSTWPGRHPEPVTLVLPVWAHSEDELTFDTLPLEAP